MAKPVGKLQMKKNEISIFHFGYNVEKNNKNHGAGIYW